MRARLVACLVPLLCLVGCVPLLSEEGRRCPCGEGYRCYQGLCSPLPPPTCGDGFVEPDHGEQCDPGDPQQYLGHATCQDCVVVCDEGYADCTGDLICEQSLDEQFSCGTCDHRCERDSTACRNGHCLVPVAVEPDGIVALHASEEQLTWLTFGSSHPQNGHNSDTALRVWGTSVKDEIVPLTLESSLGPVLEHLDIAGVLGEKSIFWVTQEQEGVTIHRRNHDWMGFSATPFRAMYEFGGFLGSRYSDSHYLYWSGVNMVGAAGIFGAVVGEDEVWTLVENIGLVDHIQGWGDYIFWRAADGVWRREAPDGAPQKIIDMRPTALTYWANYVYWVHAGNLYRWAFSTQENELVVEDGQIYEVQGAQNYIAWLRHGETTDELWADYNLNDAPYYVLSTLEPAKLLHVTPHGFSWVEGDQPGSLYYLRVTQ